MTGPGSALRKLERVGKALEDAVLVVLLTSMVLLGAGQIILRNVFDIGFLFTDELLRLLVLWLAVAGAVAASRQDRHISIAVLDRFLPKQAERAVKAVVHGFTAVVCGLISWHSLVFVHSSYAYGDTLLGHVPAWIPQVVMPLGFGLISWRFLLFMVKDCMALLRKTASE